MINTLEKIDIEYILPELDKHIKHILKNNYNKINTIKIIKYIKKLTFNSDLNIVLNKNDNITFNNILNLFNELFDYQLLPKLSKYRINIIHLKNNKYFLPFGSDTYRVIFKETFMNDNVYRNIAIDILENVFKSNVIDNNIIELDTSQNLIFIKTIDNGTKCVKNVLFLKYILEVLPFIVINKVFQNIEFYKLNKHDIDNIMSKYIKKSHKKKYNDIVNKYTNINVIFKSMLLFELYYDLFIVNDMIIEDNNMLHNEFIIDKTYETHKILPFIMKPIKGDKYEKLLIRSNKYNDYIMLYIGKESLIPIKSQKYMIYDLSFYKNNRKYSCMNIINLPVEDSHIIKVFLSSSNNINKLYNKISLLSKIIMDNVNEIISLIERK